MTDQDPEASKLDLERRRLELDDAFRREELEEKRATRLSDEARHSADNALKQKELEFAQGRGLRFSTTQATVAAAALALISGIIGGLIQASATKDVEAGKSAALIQIERVKADASIALERQKFETTLILKATESPERDDQIRNLQFFLNAGFIRDPDEKIAKMSVQDYPSAPPPDLSSRGPPEGLTDDPAVRALNVFKNREATPRQTDVDQRVTLATLLAPGNDESRFDATKAATIVGFITDVKLSGPNSANFKSTRAEERDITIHLAATRDAARNQQVFVVVTPRLRQQMQASGVDWTLRTLRSLIGQRVQVSGWLLFNAPHSRWAENTNPGGANNFRATAWEIHPVTEVKILDNAASTGSRIPK